MYVLSESFDGGHSGRETPSSIPNLEAKPAYADGTALVRVWESRKLPSIIFSGLRLWKKYSDFSLLVKRESV